MNLLTQGAGVGAASTAVTTTTVATPMSTTTKVLIGASVLAVAFVGYKMLHKKSRRVKNPISKKSRARRR